MCAFHSQLAENQLSWFTDKESKNCEMRTVMVKININSGARAILSRQNLLAELVWAFPARLLPVFPAMALSSLLATRGATLAVFTVGAPLNCCSLNRRAVSDCVKTKSHNIDQCHLQYGVISQHTFCFKQRTFFFFLFYCNVMIALMAHKLRCSRII